MCLDTENDKWRDLIQTFKKKLVLLILTAYLWRKLHASMMLQEFAGHTISSQQHNQD